MLDLINHIPSPVHPTTTIEWQQSLKAAVHDGAVTQEACIPLSGGDETEEGWEAGMR